MSESNRRSRLERAVVTDFTLTVDVYELESAARLRGTLPESGTGANPDSLDRVTDEKRMGLEGWGRPK